MTLVRCADSSSLACAWASSCFARPACRQRDDCRHNAGAAKPVVPTGTDAFSSRSHAPRSRPIFICAWLFKKQTCCSATTKQAPLTGPAREQPIGRGRGEGRRSGFQLCQEPLGLLNKQNKAPTDRPYPTPWRLAVQPGQRRMRCGKCLQAQPPLPAT